MIPHDKWSMVGTPQGDGLSPVLFTVYLEAALREVREVLGQDNSPNEISYADDVDFIRSKEFVDTIIIEPIMKKCNLKLNVAKTENTKLIRDKEEDWTKSKKVGSLLGGEEDITSRKILVTAAMNKLNKIWQSKLKKGTKLKTYSTLVKSVLLYNSGTWGL